MPVVILALCCLAFGAFVSAWRHRTRLEFRAELFDRLANACRRGMPLPPFLTALATGRKRNEQVLLAQLAEGIGQGASLADGLAAWPRTIVPAPALGAVRAAEGTSRFPAVLQAAASDAGDTLALRHRAFLAGLYPLLLTVLILGVHLLTVRYFESWIVVTDDPARPSYASPAAWVATAIVGVALGFALLGVLSRAFGAYPGARRLATARVLQTSGLLVEAGLPLTEAFGRAADAAGSRRLGRLVRDAVAEVESGDSTDLLFDVFRLPAVDRLRLGAAGSRVGTVLQDVAASCSTRWRALNEAWMRRLGPLTVLAVGLLVLVDFRIVMGVLEQARFDVGLW